VTQSVPQANGTTVTNTYNYYGAGTVGGSARDPGTSGAGPHSGVGSSPGEGPTDQDVADQLGAPGNPVHDEIDLSTALSDDVLVLSGSCPDPTTVTVFGSSVEIDVVSKFCTLADMISGLVLASGLLAAVLIVVKGV